MVLNIPDYLTNSVVLSSLAFLVLVLIMVYRTATSIKAPKTNPIKFFIIVSLILITWFVLVIAIGIKGFFAINPLFAANILLSFLILFHFLRMAYHSEKIREIADKISPTWIIAIQTYRIVGIGFIFLYFRGVLPAAFAFPSGIGDILVGITAPFVALAYFLKKPYSKKLAIIWNIIGIADLVIALTVGILGFPRPIQFVPLEVSTEPISLYPLVIIPLFAVPLALLLHFFSLRVLRKKDL